MVRASASAQLTIIKQVIIFLLIRWILQVMTINLVICPAFGDLDHEKSKNQKGLIDIPLDLSHLVDLSCQTYQH